MRADNETSKIQLWCIPCAGGSSFAYSAWKRQFEQRLRVHPIDLPGRGRRLREVPTTCVEEAVEDLLAKMLANFNDPIALFGHSMGSLLALECARGLERSGWRVKHLFVGAGIPPHLLPVGGLAEGSDERLVTYLKNNGGTPPEIMQDQPFMKLLLRGLRADLRLIEDFRNNCCEIRPVACSITAYFGCDDKLVSLENIREWRKYTSGTFRLERVDGDHFTFLKSTALMARIQSDLLD